MSDAPPTYEVIPSPPPVLREREDYFVPGPDLADWVVRTFIDEAGPLYTSHHAHLKWARIAVLWTNAEYQRKGKRVCGRASLATAPFGVYGWDRGRAIQQLHGWFGDWFDGAEPDFLIEVDAAYVSDRLAEDDPAAVCALIDHELCHCGHDTDEFGAPAFAKDGRPKWKIIPHDVELFIHEVERYGAYNETLERLHAAFEAGPSVSTGVARGVCGCGAPVAV